MKTIWLVLGVFAVVVLGGCFASNPADINAFMKPEADVVSAADYVLSPPDEIEIRSSKIPELNEQRQIIRPDGKISLEGVGDIAVAGRTTAQVADIIRENFNQKNIPLLGFYSGVEVAPLLGKSRGLDWTGVLWVMAEG